MNKRFHPSYYRVGDIIKGCKLLDHPDRDHWKIQCTNGHETIVHRCKFTQSFSMCVDCARDKRYLGRKLGKLLVIQALPSNVGHTCLICRCDCGNIKELTSHSFNKKSTKNGCDDCKKIAQSERNKTICPFVRDPARAHERVKNVAIKKYVNKKINIFHILEFVDFLPNSTNTKRNATFKCQCDCGNIVQLKGSKIVSRSRCCSQCKLPRKYTKSNKQIDVFDVEVVDDKPKIIDLPDEIKDIIITCWRSKLYSIEALATMFKQNIEIIKHTVENEKKA